MKRPQPSEYQSARSCPGSAYHDISLQASGGVSSLQDVKELKKNKIDKVIIGKALYENKFTLQEVLKC